MTSDSSVGRANETARNLALVNYGLLFAAIFFAGVPALIAVIIAYAQRDECDPKLRSHHDFQIRIFWVAFALTLAAGICFLAALVSGVAELFQYTQANGWDTLGEIRIDLSQLTIDGAIVGLVVASLVLTFLCAVWLIAAPAFGFIRLASERGIGHHGQP
ncbi:hypothetical protein [Phenylobacterium sp.]|uniref:hypothetical protein n=1 Tax=Phenylobacterium sp. TaxID=1871053 RepID=UPI0035B02440